MTNRPIVRIAATMLMVAMVSHVAIADWSIAPKSAGGFRSMMEPAEAARYDAYWQRYAPKQVAPGTGGLDFTRVSGRTGAIENSRVIYDQFGRQQYRIDFADHLRPGAHSSPHLHEYQYGPGHDPYREILHNLNGK
jgi:hypothetical protein